jgi:hypothetical protein
VVEIGRKKNIPTKEVQQIGALSNSVNSGIVNEGEQNQRQEMKMEMKECY